MSGQSLATALNQTVKLRRLAKPVCAKDDQDSCQKPIKFELFIIGRNLQGSHLPMFLLVV